MIDPGTLALHQSLQDSMIAAASRDRDVVQVGPFRALLSRTTDFVFSNYAVPTGHAYSRETVEELKSEFLKRSRTPRLEFIEALDPDLPALLEACGFESQGRMPLMVCTKAMFVPHENPAALIRVLSPADDPRSYIRAGASAFEDDSPINEGRIDQQRRLMRTGVVCAQAEEAGEAVSVACLVPALGAAELAGVGTIASHRRRGLASAVSSLLLERMFSDPDSEGVIAWLSAGGEVPRAVYEKLGFKVIGTQCHYILEGP